MRYLILLFLGLPGATLLASGLHGIRLFEDKKIQLNTSAKELNIEDVGEGVQRFGLVAKHHKINLEFEVETGEPTVVSDEYQMAFGIVPNIRAEKLKWLKIHLDSKLVTLPRTSYDRLYQTKIIKCQFSAGGFELIIFGGDGADAYVCTLSFNYKRLKKREICALDKSFPSSSEVTIYRDDYEDFSSGKAKK
ncbi:hypothetical protein [Geothrix oryzae]|uniref:hypothetical protein n=1 Tax=Geothrix oryzae TaxID=2927975 RepID=UPI002572A858|nr:hypothetical protein [Geothrix oryzae]